MGAGPAARGMRDCRTIESLASRLAGASAERAPGDRGMGLLAGGLWSKRRSTHMYMYMYMYSCYMLVRVDYAYMYM